MKLEWFRNHQGKFWIITACFVIPGMVWFGASPGSNVGSSLNGPSASLARLDGTREHYSYGTIHSLRMEQWRIRGGGSEVTTQEAMDAQVRYLLSRDLGMQVGTKEMIENIRNSVMGRTGKDKMTRELYDILLERIELSKEQFVRLIHEQSVVSKFHEVARHTKTTDEALYLDYCQEKMKVRFLYKQYESKEYEAQVEAPTDEEIQEYFDEYNAVEKDDPDALLTSPAMSVDAFYLPLDTVKKAIKPTDKELEEYFKRYRVVIREWHKEIGDGETPSDLEDRFKKFDEVKEDVRKRFVDENITSKANDLLAAFGKELEKAEEAAQKEGKPLDLTAFAEKAAIKHWRTDLLSREAYNDGEEKIGAKNFKLAVNLYALAEPAENEEEEATKARRRKRLQHATPVLRKTPEEGRVAMRVAQYQGEERMTLEQAKPVILKRLIGERAIAMAEKDAQKAYDTWAGGEDLPDPKTMKDETLDRVTPNQVASAYFREPRALGEIIPVQRGVVPADTQDPDAVRANFLVGWAVERQLPDWDAYEKDTTWNRGMKRQQFAMQRNYHRQMQADEYLLQLGKVERTPEPDPSLSGGGPLPPPGS